MCSSSSTITKQQAPRAKVQNACLWYRSWRLGLRFWVVFFHLGRVFNRHYVPADTPVLLVCNHQSYLDPMLGAYGLKREVYFMGRETLFKNKLFGRFIASVNTFPLKRGQVDIGAIKKTLRLLRTGYSVLLFPEGTRTRDGTISLFKPGIAMLARKANVPVVPVVIDGAFEAWPRNSTLLPKFWTPLRVSYCQPFWPQQIKDMGNQEFVQMLHRRMVKMQNELRSRFGLKLFDYQTKAQEKQAT